MAESGPIEIFDDFEHFLERHASPFFKAVDTGGQSAELPVVMLKRACDFARETLRAIKTHLREGHGPFLACNLCRPLYELAFRLLWAAREDYGWDRLRVWLADEDMKWAKDARLIKEFEEHAKQLVEPSKAILSLTDGHKRPIRKPPSLKGMLKQIEQHDGREHLPSTRVGQADFEYVAIYRILCRPAHAHIGAISGLHGEAFLPILVFGSGNATFALARAMIHLGAKEPEKEIEALAREMVNAFSKFTRSLQLA